MGMKGHESPIRRDGRSGVRKGVHERPTSRKGRSTYMRHGGGGFSRRNRRTGLGSSGRASKIRIDHGRDISRLGRERLHLEYGQGE